ncbi:copper(I)-binding protein [Crossiella equi]|uniref:Copper(I)-binding protein n=1 Tax=Crossiella equi TaxID=130796 RepID=A0ABS5AF06_9PSEU|nr:hypothetical protein [Crossiella equi]MBP2475169.1 copper(I)-binding protein [Crossiella equi]
MSRVEQKAVRARLVPAALGLGIALAVTGCGAGVHSQTAVQVAAVNGVSGKVGAIELRDGQFAFPAQKYYGAGTTAPLLITLVNTGANDDKLVAVKSTSAKSAELKGDTKLPAGFALRAGEEDKSGGHAPVVTSAAPSSTSATGTSGNRPSGTGTSTSGTSTSGTSVTGTSAASPSASSTLKVGNIELALTGLTSELRPGLTIPVTFVFEKAGEVTLQVPIAADEEHREELPGSGGHGGESEGSGGH